MAAIQTPEKEGVDYAGVDKRQGGLSTCGKRGVYINTDLNNTDSNNTISNHIISEDDVKRQIRYDYFGIGDKDLVDNIVSLMAEIYNTDDSKLIRINSGNIPVHMAKEQFRKITYDHVLFVLQAVKNVTEHIGNIRAYMLTTLYNAPSTMELYYQNRVMADTYGEQRGNR